MNEVVQQMPSYLLSAQPNNEVEPIVDRVLQNTSRPLLLNLDFDPGWQSLRTEFQAQAVRAEKDFSYAEKFMQRNPVELSISSVHDFMSLMPLIAEADEKRRKEICVGFNGDVRLWDNFVIDSNDKMVRLYKHMKMRDVFTKNMNGSARLSDFPRFFWFDPVQEGRKLAGSVFTKSQPIAERTRAELHGRPKVPNDSKLLIGLEANMLHDDAGLRQRINLNGEFGLIAAPYVRDVAAMKRAENDVFDTYMTSVVNRANISVNIDHAAQFAYIDPALSLNAAE